MRAASPGVLAAVLGVTFLVACRPSSQEGQQPAETPPAEQPASTPTPTADLQCPPCEGDCSNYPFQPTDCWTTKHGPAKADVVEGPTNLLYCKDTPFALCFFSGPPTPTGTNPAGNQPLPCVLEGDVANCTCKAYKQASYVDINGILNLGAYQETVQLCGSDGSGCANFTNHQLQEAPVCEYVRQQNSQDPKVSLMPKADLISTFSTTAMKPSYQVSLRNAPQCEGRYAGCMTAPCFFPGGTKRPFSDGDLITCKCPTFVGKYQVGQAGYQCDIPSSEGDTYYVWSAANHLGGISLE